MKKIIALCALAVLAAMPLSVHAATFVGGGQYSRGPQDRVSDDLYVGGGNVLISSEVAGDVSAFGGTVEILGPVGGTIRSISGQLLLGDRVEGDLVVAGGSVRMLSSAVVTGDVYVMAGQMTIDGTVRGDVRMRGGKLTINGLVQGDVTADTKTAPVIGQGGRVGGTVSYREPLSMGGEDRMPRRILMAVITMLTAIEMLAYLGATVAVVWWCRRPVLSLFHRAHHAFWSSVGRGAVYAILVPIAAGLLVISFVGLIPGGLALLLYAGLVIVAKVLAGMYFGAWISAAVAKKPTLDITWTNALLGVIAFQFLSFIPVLGWLVQTVVFLAVFGVLARTTQEAIV